jgi:hypothetical protein
MRRFKHNLPLLMALRASDITVEPAAAREGMARIVQALTDLLKPDQHRLRLPADSIAWLLISMIMCHNPKDAVSGDDMVTVILDGALFPEVKKELAC